MVHCYNKEYISPPNGDLEQGSHCWLSANFTSKCHAYSQFFLQQGSKMIFKHVSLTQWIVQFPIKTVSSCRFCKTIIMLPTLALKHSLYSGILKEISTHLQWSFNASTCLISSFAGSLWSSLSLILLSYASSAKRPLLSSCTTSS